jgi:hypothetical protein
MESRQKGKDLNGLHFVGGIRLQQLLQIAILNLTQPFRVMLLR